MTLLEEYARLAEELGLGSYRPTSTGGSLFLGRLPDQPDLAVAIARYAGGESDAKLGYDDIRLQFRVRGPHTDYALGEALAQRVYDELHGLHSRALPGGTWMVDLIGLQSGPIDIGTDQKHRPEWTLNFRSEVHRPTPGRA
ncbi:minor capsid protein [Saccharothrix sp. HUAS TT1]|uniref:minor capsid protein n=1 Tax=unclassified Saccharothrix TaxID=2593673 RepID=UPI00345B5C7B